MTILLRMGSAENDTRCAAYETVAFAAQPTERTSSGNDEASKSRATEISAGGKESGNTVDGKRTNG